VVKVKNNEIEAVKLTLSQEKDTHANQMKAKDEELERAHEQRQRLELEMRILRQKKVMRVLLSSLVL
jgi:hypothetical protein